MYGIMRGPPAAYLMTVAQPNTTLSEVLPPVMLEPQLNSGSLNSETCTYVSTTVDEYMPNWNTLR